VDIRLAWWREAIDEVYAGKAPRAHPVLTAFATVAPLVPMEHWRRIIEARRLSGGHFASWESVDAFIHNTAEAVMHLALHASATSDEVASVLPLVEDAALAWGHIGFARSSIFSMLAPGPLEEGIARAERACGRVLSSRRRPSSNVFPAIGYATLVPGYIRALRRGARGTPLFARQLKMIAAAATGRL
jgi:15-cis-phytoene synthase